ncbi:TPA: hypothetical protein ACG5DM_005139 [Pseudomonas putida]
MTLFDKGFYSLGLLHHWQSQGEHRHWLIPLKKGTQYEVEHNDQQNTRPENKNASQLN